MLYLHDYYMANNSGAGSMTVVVSLRLEPCNGQSTMFSSPCTESHNNMDRGGAFTKRSKLEKLEPQKLRGEDIQSGNDSKPQIDRHINRIKRKTMVMKSDMMFWLYTMVLKEETSDRW